MFFAALIAGASRECEPAHPDQRSGFSARTADFPTRTRMPDGVDRIIQTTLAILNDLFDGECSESRDGRAPMTLSSYGKR